MCSYMMDFFLRQYKQGKGIKEAMTEAESVKPDIGNTLDRWDVERYQRKCQQGKENIAKASYAIYIDKRGNI